MSYVDLKKSFIEEITKLSHGRRAITVFSDFSYLSRLSIQSSCSVGNKKTAAEERYKGFSKLYSRSELNQMANMLGMVTLALSDFSGDFLGEVYQELNLTNKDCQQFFTPYSVAQAISGVTLDESSVKELIGEKGYLTIDEPASGTGTLILAAFQRLREIGFNPQKHLFVRCMDLDCVVANCCYIQLSLLGLPCVVMHGNTLTKEVHETFYSPFFILNGWSFRLSTRVERKEAALENNEQLDLFTMHS